VASRSIMEIPRHLTMSPFYASKPHAPGKLHGLLGGSSTARASAPARSRAAHRIEGAAAEGQRQHVRHAPVDARHVLPPEPRKLSFKRVSCCS